MLDKQNEQRGKFQDTDSEIEGDAFKERRNPNYLQIEKQNLEREELDLGQIRKPLQLLES